MALRTPSAWAAAQRSFHLAYDADPTRFERREVVLDWADLRDQNNEATRSPDRLLQGFAGLVGLGLAVRNVFRGRFEGPEVTVLTTEGTTKAMRFPADLDRPPGPEVTDIATLVGEIGTNAVCCVELADTVIWPSYNPTELTRPC